MACAFLGYPSGYKGYKLLDLTTNKVFVSRDVVFHEHTFPFHSPNTSLPTSSFPLHIPLSSQPDSPSQHILSIDHILSSPAAPPHASSLPVKTTSSGRIIKSPKYLNDYICGNIQSNCAYPISNFVSYSNLSPSYASFIAAINVVPEPSTYAKASTYAEWREAMRTELDALHHNQTWSLVPLPKGKTAIGCKWIYKTKFQSDGTVERYKARLVAKGYT